MTTLTRADGSRRRRIIEMWFPSAEVSAASQRGWGSSNSEILLMSWFAKRPLAQSRAATLCSLLPWPDTAAEQDRVQAVLREALGTCQDPDWDATSGVAHEHGIIDCARLDRSGGYDAARRDVLALLSDAYGEPSAASTLDPFSGRGLIPLESARYGITAHAMDYSPVATLATRLLTDWPFRDWSQEPPLPFGASSDGGDSGVETAIDPADPLRLVHDIALLHAEVQHRVAERLDDYYPDNADGEKPWGYLWAQVIPCNGCGRRIPLYANNVLRRPRGKDMGASFELVVDGDDWFVEVVDEVTDELPTMRARKGRRGKLAWCPFTDCGHAHELAEHKRLARDNYHDVEMLVVADLQGTTKTYREPTPEDAGAAVAAESALSGLKLDTLPARPDEHIPIGNDHTIRSSNYGAETYGDLAIERQNLLHATIADELATLASEMEGAGLSRQYAAALIGYCGATLARKLKRSTRGARMEVMRSGGVKVGDVFVNESSIAHNYDFFEAGIGTGPGTWDSVSGTPSALDQILLTDGRPVDVQRGSATALPWRDGAMAAVVTDPPYDDMITYSDASDLYWVWLRRALGGHHFDFAMTADVRGVQEKADELIVKGNWSSLAEEHRDPEHYRSGIAQAMREARRVVTADGVVSIVFGSGDPEVWRRLLDAVVDSGLVPVGAWPANTEKGGAAGSANISTTLTLACRPAAAERPSGRVADVDARIRQLVAQRVKDVWDPSGLSLPDQKMAAVGPAMEVVGAYDEVLDITGEPVGLDHFLPVARRAVTQAWNLRFDQHPLEVFDPATRFALEWVRTNGRRVASKDEAGWQLLGDGMDEDVVANVLERVSKGVRFPFSHEVDVEVATTTEQVEIALAMAGAWRAGSLDDCGDVLARARVDADDDLLWTVIAALSSDLPETDDDGATWRQMVQHRAALVAAAGAAASVTDARRAFAAANPSLDLPDTTRQEEAA